MECYLINTRPVIVVVHNNQMGWDVSTSYNTNTLSATLEDAEKRVDLK